MYLQSDTKQMAVPTDKPNTKDQSTSIEREKKKHSICIHYSHKSIKVQNLAPQRKGDLNLFSNIKNKLLTTTGAWGQQAHPGVIRFLIDITPHCILSFLCLK
jgi:ribosomal protein L18